MTYAPGRHKTINVWPIARIFASPIAEELQLPILEEAPAVVVAATADMQPRLGTIRGGELLIFYGTAPIGSDAEDVSFLVQSAPTGWTDAGTVTYSLGGTRLSVPPAAASSASLTSSAEYQSFDATLNARLQRPSSITSDEVNVLTFRYVIDVDNYAQVRLRRVAQYGSALVFADSELGLGTRIQPGGGVFLGDVDVSLQVVRHDCFCFLFVNGQMLDSTPFFSQTELGSFEVSVSNGTANVAVSTRVENLTLRSHAIIKDKLVDSKTEISTHRMTGLVPAATVADLGLHDSIIFGPWGSTTLTDGFEYLRPDRLRVGQSNQSTLQTYSDSLLRG